MPRKPNYRFERVERERRQAERKARRDERKALGRGDAAPLSEQHEAGDAAGKPDGDLPERGNG
jgi:hypothetical protein